MEPTLKQKVLMKEKWLKALFVLIFGLMSYVIQIAVWVIAVVQFLFLLFSGSANRRLTEFGESLSMYIYQITLFLTFSSEEKPFPFGELPKKKSEHHHHPIKND